MKLRGKVWSFDNESVINTVDKNGRPKEIHKNGFTIQVCDEVNGRVSVHVTTYAPDFKPPKPDSDITIDIRSGERLDSGNWEVVLA